MTNKPNTTAKPHIFSFTLERLQEFVQHHGIPKFKAGQIWQNVYTRGVTNVQNITNLSKPERELLASELNCKLPQITAEQKASDGVVKWLLKLHDEHEVEAVFIPEFNQGQKYRGTLCVSSQVGCTTSCRFCHTGTQGLARSLTASEIIAQVMLAKIRLGEFGTATFADHYGDDANAPLWDGHLPHRKGAPQGHVSPKEEGRMVTNIVFMGMGEPLFNADSVKKSISIMMDDKGLGLGSRKITVSSSGVAPQIVPLGEELGVQLAISLHAPNDEIRTKIMPINKKWPLDELMAEIRAFPLKERRRITWEYTTLAGVNDSEETAEELAQLIKGIPSLVNIIPFNEWPGSPFKCSSKAQIRKFADVLKRHGIDTTIRKTRGTDILAACGQLRGETSKRNTVSMEFPTVVEKYGSDVQKQKLKVKIEE